MVSDFQLVLSTNGMFLAILTGAACEKARYRKANGLVNGSTSQRTNKGLLPRARTIFTYHTSWASRLTTGTRKAINQIRGILAARSRGMICSTGTHTRKPGAVCARQQI